MKFTTRQSLVLLSSFQLASCHRPEHIEVDVAVVGAGLSGLAAARKLLDAGKTVHIIEARDRVGGRVQNQHLNNGGVTELGAAFVGPTQDRVLALADELNLTTFTEYAIGNNLAFIDGIRYSYGQGSPIPSVDNTTTNELIATVLTLDKNASSIDPQKPWAHPSAELWDNTTLAQFRDTLITTSAARGIFDISVEAVFSARPDQLSLLYALAYTAAAGNSTNPGNFLRLISTGGGAQDRRMMGGTALLPRGLADKIGRKHLSLNSPVHSVEKQSCGHYLVTTTSDHRRNYGGAPGRHGPHALSVLASKVVVAMSPPMAGRIKYSPALPSLRREAMKRFKMGSIGKANAIYATPFWRSGGYSGQVISTSGVVRTTFDASDANGTYGAILGFIEADQIRNVDNATDAEIIARVTEDYVRYFGEEARNATEWVVKKWDLEPFSRGGPTAVAGVGVFKKYGPALREKSGGIHWAGTESSDYWTGYMDGAIRSGERAAQEIIDEES